MKYKYRIRHWIQDTIEAGHWELTGLMTKKQVDIIKPQLEMPEIIEEDY